MKSNVFREYDIRGIVDTELPLSEMGDLARAIATYFKRKSPKFDTLVVGRDGRTHSPEIKEKMVDALIDMGIDVMHYALPTANNDTNGVDLPMIIDLYCSIWSTHNDVPNSNVASGSSQKAQRLV